MNILQGKKTYIIAFLLAVATFCKAMGYIDPGTFATVEGLLGSFGLMALRSAVSTG